ncbi:MAG: hypothetical protein ACRD4O_06905, partial [Bryobacteraceae bacterium]
MIDDESLYTKSLATMSYTGLLEAVFLLKSSETPDARRGCSGVFISGASTMATEAQIAANRENAQHSTGPKT